MDWIFVAFMSLNIALAIFMIIFAVWIIIPKGFYFLEKWKVDQHPRSFSAAIFCFFTAVACLSFVGIWGARKIAMFESYFAPGYVKLLLSVLLSYLLLYFSLPRTVTFYQKWRNIKKNHYFSSSVLFAFISVFFMYIMCSLYLPTFVR